MLTKTLSDKEAPVRRNACLALGGIGSASAPAVPKLIQLCERREPDNEVRRYAVEALAYIGQAPNSSKAVEQSIPTLRSIIRDKKDNWRVRQRAVWALSNVPDLAKAGVVPDLESVLDEKDNASKLVRERDNGSKLVRYEAAVLLGIRLGPKVSDEVLDVLLENLLDEDVRVFSATAEGGVPNVPEIQSSRHLHKTPAGCQRWHWRKLAPGQTAKILSRLWRNLQTRLIGKWATLPTAH